MFPGKFPALLILLFFLPVNRIYADEDIIATVESVYDGDTFHINIDGIHPVFGDHLGVRVNGIDSPEILDARPEFKARAREAREAAKVKLLNRKVRLTNIKRDKYFRIRADVEIIDTREDFGKYMIRKKYAKPYNGEKRN